MVPFGGNREEVTRYTHGITQTDNGEAITADSRRGVGDARVRSSAGSGGNEVGDDIYMETVGNCGTVGGGTADIRSVFRGEGI